MANVPIPLLIGKIACTFIPNLTKNFKVKKLLFPLAIVVLVVGCKKENEELVFAEFNLEEVSDTNCYPEEENCAFININTPLASGSGSKGKNLNRQIEKHIIHLMDYQGVKKFNSLESLAQGFIDDYEASAKEFPEYDIAWEASIDGKIIHNSPELISMEFRMGLFTGGAHGYTGISFLNFNPETGKLLTQKELFDPAFRGFAEKIFRQKNNIPENEPINSTGFLFEEEKFQLPKNIGFSEKKLLLRYNPYEVASYADGSLLLEIPLEEAKKYMKLDNL